MPRRIPLVLLATAGITACSQSASQASKEPPKQYPIHGEVVRVDPQAKSATINATKIEGWMEAMSMEYPVKDSQDFSKLRPNECIDATVMVQGADFWVSDIKPSDAAPGTCVPPKAQPPSK